MNMRYVLLLVFVMICALVCQPALAQDAKELEKQLQTELRNAQSAMFNGKLDVADAGSQKCAQLIDSLKKADPQHKLIASFEQRLGKLQKDLSKKIKKVPVDGGKMPGKVPAPAAATARSKSLPRKTSQAMRELSKTLDSLEKFEKDRMQRIQQDYSSYSATGCRLKLRFDHIHT